MRDDTSVFYNQPAGDGRGGNTERDRPDMRRRRDRWQNHRSRRRRGR